MTSSLDSIRRPVEEALEQFDTFVKQSFKVSDNEMLEGMVNYVLNSRGKGLRPTIVMLVASAIGGERALGKRVMLAATLVEMIHLASLVHDDVIDESDLRRGRPSPNAIWQSHNAVLLGDYILARNMMLGLGSGQFDLVNHIVGNMASLCEGEILQSLHSKKLDTDRNTYYDIIYHKTACLFATAASAGAMAVGADKELRDEMFKFGENIGMAFQIADDILDYIGDATTGKPTMEDLKEGKITLPLIAAMEMADTETSNNIVACLASCADDEDKREYIARSVVTLGGIESANETMNAFLSKGMSCLSHLDDSKFRDALLEVCAFVAERDR